MATNPENGQESRRLAGGLPPGSAATHASSAIIRRRRRRRRAKAPKRRRGQDPARVVGGLELAEVLGAVPHGAVRLVSWPDDLKHPPIMQLWPFCRHLLSD